MPKFMKVDPEFFRHEALHTTSILVEMLNTHLLEHTYSKSNINPRFTELLNNAFDSLSQAYQACAEENELEKHIYREDYSGDLDENSDDEIIIEFVAPKTETINLNNTNNSSPLLNQTAEKSTKEPQLLETKQQEQIATPSEIAPEKLDDDQIFSFITPKSTGKDKLDLDLVKQKADLLIADNVLDFDITPLISEIGTATEFQQNHVLHAFFSRDIKLIELDYEAIINKLELNNFIKTSYTYNDVILNQQLTFTKEEYNTYLDRKDNEFYNPISKEPCDKDEAIQSIEINYVATQQLIQFVQECLV